MQTVETDKFNNKITQIKDTEKQEGWGRSPGAIGRP